jgi:hypothetical protein
MRRIVALGAETQAASSLALAYPSREVLCISDQPVLDGWDLRNTRFRHATPDGWHAAVEKDDVVVPLCARWLPAADWALARTLPRAAATIGDDLVVPVREQPGDQGAWQVKGNRWHRPDAPLAGPLADLAAVPDPHGCGLVFQPWLETEGTVMAIGHRAAAGGVVLGLFRVHEERFFRAVVLQAAETIADQRLAELSLAVLAALDHAGHFTLNWLLTRAGPRLSSVRPAPRAAFGAFRRGGLDALEPPDGVSMLRAGLRLIAQPHYSSYRRLEA